MPDAANSSNYREEEKNLLLGNDTPDSEATQEERLSRRSAFALGDLFRVVIVLVLFSLAIYFLIYVIKRSQRKYDDSELIRVLASKALHTNRSLHLVEISGRVFLLGSGEQSVSLIAEITDKEQLDELHLQVQSDVKKRNRFIDLLFPKRLGGTKRDNTSSSGLSTLRKSIEKLEQMK